VTTLSALLLGLTGVLAVADWVAVHRSHRPAEYLFKPATLVALIGAAAALDVPDGPQGWFIAALVFSLAGDVFLMLPSDMFMAGLASFAVGHVFYIAGFAADDPGAGGMTLGAVVVVASLAVLGPRIVKAVASTDTALVGPVMAYIGVISAMVIVAFGSGHPIAMAGALLFYASDATIAWNRFVAEVSSARLVIITTYHLGQIGLVLSLVA